MKLLLSLIAAALFFGCSTAPPRSPSRDAMCNGNKASNSFKFYVVNSTKPAKGIPLDEANSSSDKTQTVADELTRYLINNLALTTLDEDGTLIRTKLWKRSELIRKFPEAFIGWDWKRKDGVHVVLTSKNPLVFVVCEHKQCDGLVDPMSKAEIESWRFSGADSHRAGGLPWQTSDVSKLNTADLKHANGFYGYNGPSSSVLANLYVSNDIGAYAGLFSTSRYLAVPNDEKSRVCRELGKLKVSETACMTSIQDLTKSGINLEEAVDRLNSFWMTVAFGSNTKQTRRVEDSWIIREVTFDPTPLCEFARPRRELLTE